MEIIIPLTKGKYAQIDAEDIPKVQAYSWHAMMNKAGNWYAVSKVWLKNEKRYETILMHRLLSGATGRTQVDHCNHDSLDNRRANLRVCTAQENQRNRRKREGTTSRYKGVYWCKYHNKWAAKIKLVDKSYNTHLGYFPTEAEAAKAYNVAAVLHFGEFACVN